MLLKFLVLGFIGAAIITTFVLNQKQNNSDQPVEVSTIQTTISQSSANPSVNKITLKQTPTSPMPSPISSPRVEVSTAPWGETRVEISEEALNSQISSSLVGQSLGSTPLGEATISQSNIKIENGFMTISGTAKSGFISLPFQTKAVLELKNGQPSLSLSDLSLNGIPLPQIIADQLTSVIQSKVNDIIGSYNFKLKSISVETGKIVIVGEK